MRIRIRIVLDGTLAEARRICERFPLLPSPSTTLLDLESRRQSCSLGLQTRGSDVVAKTEIVKCPAAPIFPSYDWGTSLELRGVDQNERCRIKFGCTAMCERCSRHNAADGGKECVAGIHLKSLRLHSTRTHSRWKARLKNQSRIERSSAAAARMRVMLQLPLLLEAPMRQRTTRQSIRCRVSRQEQ